jgi:single-stranded DNA-binding protein
MVVGRVLANPWSRETASGGKVWGCTVGTARYTLDPRTQKYKVIRERHTIKCFDPRYIDIIEKTVKRGDMILAEGSLRAEPERVITEATGDTVHEHRISLDVRSIQRYTEYVDLNRPNRPNRSFSRPREADMDATLSSESYRD